MKQISRFLFATVLLAISSSGMARAQQYFWANYAGLPGSAGSQDGTTASALFSNPMATAIDSSGNVYVADTANNTIRKITSAGVVSTLAGSPGISGSADGIGSAALFNHPTGIAVSGDGSIIYVADTLNYTIRLVNASGVVKTVAGTPGVSGDVDGSALSAEFGSPVALATDGSGNIYVADSANNTIRLVSASHVVTTLAGSPGLAGDIDGTGSGALFNNPSGIATTGGIIYVADTSNNTIRQVTTTGVVTTLAGTPVISGSGDGQGSAAQFYYPSGLAVSSTGNIYVADTFNETIRIVTPTGSVSTLAGLAQVGLGVIGKVGDTNATGSAATFNSPTGVAVDANGNVYVADSANNEIRKISVGTVTTYAGGAHWGYDSIFSTVAGPAAHFNYPTGATIDSSGNVYVADTDSHLIRKIAPTTVVTTLAGKQSSQLIGIPGYVDNASGTSAEFDYPSGVAADSSGNVYVTDTFNQVIRKIVVSSTAVSTFCGTAGVIGSADGTTTAAQFNNPTGITINSAGTLLYVADTYNHTIRKITSAGVVTTIAGTPNTIGATDGVGAAALFNYPSGLAVDGSGNVYVADTGNNTIRKLTVSGTTWTSSTLAGVAGTSGNTDGTGNGALFNNPTGMSIDSSGNLYVVDTGNHTIRMITPTGVVTTIGGTPSVAGTVSGIGTAGQFSSPTGVAVGPAGLYVVDGANCRVSLGSQAGTLAATSIGTTIATLNGEANANGVANGFEFQWGTWPNAAADGTYTSSTAVQSLSGTSFGAVSANLTSLAQNATYHYRLVLTVNGVATYYGADQTFSTVPTVIPVITNTSLAGATVGIPYTAQIAASNNPTSWGASPLPAGLVVNPATGAITGTPTAASTTNVTLSATNGAGPGTKALSLVVSALPLPAFSALTFSCVTGSAFNYPITAANSPTSFGATSLPPRLVVNPVNGLINGIPTTPGNYQVTLSATNLTGTATATLNLTILPTYVWSNLAGALRAAGSTDGQAAALGLFQIPEGAATDSSGNVYVADTFNYTIRKITPAGVMTTLAGSAGQNGSSDGTGSAARFYEPTGIAVDANGNVYVADLFNSTIRKVTPAGVVTTLAGLARTPGSTDGTGSAARLNAPAGITVDSSTGLIYVADTGNDTIRTVTPTGAVTTLAGTVGKSGSADGTGTAASFSSPHGIVADGHGNLFIADSSNSTIREVTIATGAVTTIAGTAGSFGFTNGTGTAARFEFPEGITIDSNGNLYVSDTDNEAIREITTPGAVVTTYAGGVFGTTNGTGTAARFEFPYGVATDGNGNVYVADSDDDMVRKIAPGAVVTTFMGAADVAGSSDGSEGTVPEFSSPQGIAVDANDNTYVADTANNTIREITPAGLVSTLAGTAGTSGTTDGTGSAARFNAPTSLAFDSNGNLFVADSGNDTIRKLTFGAGVGWTSTTFAGTAGTASFQNGTGAGAFFNAPTGVAIDSGNNIYVADSGNQLIRKITSAAVVTTFAGTISGTTGTKGTTNGAAVNTARFNTPTGVAVDSSGNVFVADQTNNLIREISAGTVSTVAGSTAAIVDGINTAANFQGPYGIAVDGSDNLYIADTTNSAIRKISPFGASWSVTTIGGNGFGTTSNGSSASFEDPQGIAVDAQGNLLVADTFDDRVAIGAAILPPSITSSLTASGQQGTAFTYVITATPMPTPFSSFNATSLPSGLSVNTITGAITGTPTVNGSFSPTLSATNLAGTATATLGLNIASTLTPYQTWQSTQFTFAQLGNPAISGDNATPANDGIPNLLKYALGLNAFQSYNPGAAVLPFVHVVNSSGANYLALTFTGTATDVSYNVQATSSLTGTWSTIQTFSSSVGTAPGTVTVQDSQQITASSVRFMRLQVTRP